MSRGYKGTDDVSCPVGTGALMIPRVPAVTRARMIPRVPAVTRGECCLVFPQIQGRG